MSEEFLDVKSDVIIKKQGEGKPHYSDAKF